MTGNQIAYWKYAEDVRHNAEAESQNRQNLAEVARHNLATEGLTARQISLGYAQLAETKRANTAREVLTTSQLSETIRSNMAREVETNRSNLAKEEETQRHNAVLEGNELIRVNEQMRQFNENLNWQKQYEGKINTPLRVGQALTSLIGAGLKGAAMIGG